MQAIEVENLKKVYGSFVAVDGLSFSVREGEIVGLVGPNGAGKTTTLRALAGVHPPTDGRIALYGHDLRVDPIGAKRLVAFMPDEPRLFDYLTVEEHLQFTARIYGVADWRARAAALLDELQLTDRRDSLPGELSRGMKQKLMIACGLLHDPKVLIFDEPLTGLDPLGIRRMKETITKRAKDGAAVILSSHLLHLVEELCDRIVIISSGKLVAFGTIAAIKRKIGESGDASLEEAFIRLTSDEEKTG